MHSLAYKKRLSSAKLNLIYLTFVLLYFLYFLYIFHTPIFTYRIYRPITTISNHFLYHPTLNQQIRKNRVLVHPQKNSPELNIDLTSCILPVLGRVHSRSSFLGGLFVLESGLLLLEVRLLLLGGLLDVSGHTLATSGVGHQPLYAMQEI